MCRDGRIYIYRICLKVCLKSTVDGYVISNCCASQVKAFSTQLLQQKFNSVGTLRQVKGQKSKRSETIRNRLIGIALLYYPN